MPMEGKCLQKPHNQVVSHLSSTPIQSCISFSSQETAAQSHGCVTTGIGL